MILHRPGVVLPLPDWVHDTMMRNNLDLGDITDLEKLNKTLSVSDIASLTSVGPIIGNLDPALSTTPYTDIWSRHEFYHLSISHPSVTRNITDKLSFDDEAMDLLYPEDKEHNVKDFYKIETIPQGQYNLYCLMIKKGLLNLLKKPNNIDIVVRDIYKAFHTYEKPKDIYDWNLSLANRYLESLKKLQHSPSH